jgi:hypothetical protein
MTKKYKGDAHTRRLAAERQARRRDKLKAQKQETEDGTFFGTPAEFLRMREEQEDKISTTYDSNNVVVEPIKYALVSDGRTIPWRTYEDWRLKVQPHLKSPERSRDADGTIRPNDKGDDLRKLYDPEDYAKLSPYIREANEKLHGAFSQYPTDYHKWLEMRDKDLGEQSISPENAHRFLEDYND